MGYVAGGVDSRTDHARGNPWEAVELPRVLVLRAVGEHGPEQRGDEACARQVLDERTRDHSAAIHQKAIEVRQLLGCGGRWQDGQRGGDAGGELAQSFTNPRTSNSHFLSPIDPPQRAPGGPMDFRSRAASTWNEFVCEGEDPTCSDLVISRGAAIFVSRKTWIGSVRASPERVCAATPEQIAVWPAVPQNPTREGSVRQARIVASAEEEEVSAQVERTIMISRILERPHVCGA